MNWACVGDRFLTKDGYFLTVEVDEQCENPREWMCNVSRLYTWDWSWLHRIGSPDKAPNMCDIVEEFVSYDDEILPMWDEYDEDGSHAEYEWLFELEQDNNAEYLPEMILELRRRGVEVWPIVKDYYGDHEFISVERDVNERSLEYLRKHGDLIGVALIDQNEWDELGYDGDCFVHIEAEVKAYSAWLIGSVFYIDVVDENCEGVDMSVAMLGDVDGLVDLDEEFKDLEEVSISFWEWQDEIEQVREIVSPIVGHISGERARKVVRILHEYNIDLDCMGDDDWTDMMKAVTDGAA